jgi:hypothetical protein
VAREDVGSGYDKMPAVIAPVKRCRVAAALDDIDPGGMKSQSAVNADHVFIVLNVPFFLGETDVTGIEGRADNAVTAFDHEKFNGFALHFVGKIMGFAVVYPFKGDIHQAVFHGDFFMFAALEPEKRVAVADEQQGADEYARHEEEDNFFIHNNNLYYNLAVIDVLLSEVHQYKNLPMRTGVG